jgi:hypothetical protein
MSRPISKHKKGLSARPNLDTRKTKKPADISYTEKGLKAHFTEDFGESEIMHPIITSIKQQRLGI